MMNITAVNDLSNYLPSLATNMKGGEVQQAIQSAVLRQAMDQKKTEGEALVRMITSGASNPNGQFDIRV